VDDNEKNKKDGIDFRRLLMRWNLLSFVKNITGFSLSDGSKTLTVDADFTTSTGIWQIGTVLIANRTVVIGGVTTPENPGWITFLNYGTWLRFAVGQVLVGVDEGDIGVGNYDFDTIDKTGGSKTHVHKIDVPNTSSTTGGLGDVAEVDNNLVASTVNVSATNHIHDVDPAEFDSEEVKALMPYRTVFYWLRTA
jgi:hypothetical protein